MSISQEKILDSKVLQLTAQLSKNETTERDFVELLNFYFRNGRPKYFSKYKDDLLRVFPEILDTMPIENMFEAAHDLFLFARTSNDTVGDRENQDEINRSIFQPFQKKLAEMLPYIEVKKLTFVPKPDTYVILTRHASTKGMYAPGKFIYSVCKSLLKENKCVILCHLGSIDEAFHNLKIHEKFTIYHCKGSTIDIFFALRKIIQDAQPLEVLTEIELSVINLIEAIGVSSKVSLLSAGVFKTPWFDKKYLVTELYQDEDKTDQNLVPIPQVHSKELLAPECSAEALRKLKQEYDLDNKFVIGSFARYEKFTPEFLSLAKRCLTRIQNSVLILAGSNDQSRVVDFFSDEINRGKVIVLGVVNTNIFGWMIDVFLEPFPVIAGFAALESLAKGKPVFTLECAGLGNYVASRDADLVFQSQTELVAKMSSVVKSTDEYRALSQKSLEIAETFYDDKALALSIINSS